MAPEMTWPVLVKKAFCRLQSEIHATAVSKGWWEAPRSDGECVALMHSELSEALESMRKDFFRADEHCPEFTNVEIELADCIIRILDYAESRELRIGPALLAKMAFNKTRSHKHGGKRF